MTKLDKIKELLTEICLKYTDDEKRNLLKVLGYKHFYEISEISEDEQDVLIRGLKKRTEKEYITKTLNNGLITHHPKDGKYTIGDVSFTYSSWESRRKQKSYKDRYGNNTSDS